MRLKKVPGLLILLASVLFCFNCYSQPLSPYSPENNIVINNDSVLLRWNSLNNVQYYTVEISPDSAFTNIIVNQNVSLQTYFWATALPGNLKYYWHVKGFDGINTQIGYACAFTIFKPTDVTGCALWLRADTGVSLNGSAAQTWQDASVNAFNLTQSTVSLQPLFVSNSINNYPALSFDGGDNFIIPTFPYSTILSAFLVGYKPDLTAPTGLICSAPGNNFDISNGTCRVGNSPSALVGGFTLDKWGQISVTREAGNSKAYFNGIQSGATNTFAVTPIVPGNLAIGIRAPGLTPSYPFKGLISEVIFYTIPIQDTIRSRTEEYLMDKYSPQLVLGADTLLNNFCPYTISANAGFSHYLWSTGDSTSAITINESGTYVVQAIDIFDRLHIDSIIVNYPEVNQLNTFVVCSGNTLVWNTNLLPPFSFLWQDGSSGSTFSITQAGDYYIQITDSIGCIYHSDTVHVAVDNFPDIAFLGNDTILCLGNSVQLQYGANTAVNYLWSDGTTNDSLFFSTPGMYWVEVSNINSCIARDTIILGLAGIAPTADFSFNDVCIGLTANFTDNSVAPSGDVIVNWVWNFGDNSTISGVQNPGHLYASDSTYLVTLKAIGQSGCAGVINKPIHVYPHPTINFTATNNCNNNITTFHDLTDAHGGAIANWEWFFNDPGSTSNTVTGFSPGHNYNNTGNYQVMLIVNTIEGCIDTLVKPIPVKPSPVADFEHSALCLGDSIHFKDISYVPFPQYNVSRSWTFNDTIFSSGLEPVVWFDSATTYPVQLVIMASNGCRDTILETITINNLPVADYSNGNACLNSFATFNDISTCLDCSILEWMWSVNGNNVSQNNSINYLFSDTGIYIVKLEVKNDAGCKSFIEKNIVIGELPVAAFSSNAVFGSPPFEVTFINQSINGSNYLWEFGDGSSSTLFEPVHTFNDTGTYTISLVTMNLNGCSDTSSFSIKVAPEYVDLALLGSGVNLQGNYFASEITFINLGTVIIDSFNIAINTNLSNNTIVEKWENVLLPGEIKNYKLKTSINRNNGSQVIEYICFEIIDPSKGPEAKTDNNTSCKVMNEVLFEITDLYPNPVNDELNLSILSPLSAMVLLSITGNDGRIVFSSERQVAKGFNALKIETINLQNGIYNCKLTYENIVSSKQFMKLKD